MAFDPEDLDQPTVVAQVFRPRPRPTPPAEAKPAPRPPKPAPRKPSKLKDTDGDNVPDAQERRLGTRIDLEDSDGDGLRDDIEIQLGTNPLRADTDGDGADDGIEVAYGITSPRVQDPAGRVDFQDWAGVDSRVGARRIGDSDGDGFANWIEDMRGTDRRNPKDLAPDDINNLQPIDAFVSAASDQVGKPYRLGAEADPDSLFNPAFDHGELVEWAARQAGVVLPDSPSDQRSHVLRPDTAVPVAQAVQTPGALVFGVVTDPVTGERRPQVAISVGGGKVIDVDDQGVFRVMEPKPIYTQGSMIPELHRPTGDLDGDGTPDLDELLMNGDISKGRLQGLSAVGGTDHDALSAVEYNDDPVAPSNADDYAHHTPSTADEPPYADPYDDEPLPPDNPPFADDAYA